VTAPAVPGVSAPLVAEGVSKSFAGVHALTDVSLDVRAGEVLALMGENGAGKSTLLKIFTADHAPDSGRLLVDGAPVHFSGPADARTAGIRVIGQEPEIVPHVSVAENIAIGALPHRRHRFAARELEQRVTRDIEAYGFGGGLSARTLGSDLSPAQRQLVEILRALSTSPRVLAFDEPTSSLGDAETEALFALIERLRADGVAVVYVSHRMAEIFRVADRVAVLRDGRLVAVRPAAEVDEGELVRMMVGRDLASVFAREERDRERVVLQVDAVTTDDVTDVSLTVRAGEVVALSGLVGAGRSELVKALVGDVPLRSGTVSVDGQALRLRSPRDAVRAGIGFAPEERKAQALVMGRSVRDNVSLAILDRLSRWRLVDRGEERRVVREQTDRLRVRTPSIEHEVRKLSGGNQQKVVLARWLVRRPKVLILDEPTRGVDVGAKADIYRIINALAADGMAVLVVSSELPEVIGLADRVLVMRAGRLTGELSREQATEERILALALPDVPDLPEAPPPGTSSIRPSEGALP
jgi:L-arabinose transport system ATP-binding protein